MTSLSLEQFRFFTPGNVLSSAFNIHPKAICQARDKRIIPALGLACWVSVVNYARLWLVCTEKVVFEIWVEWFRKSW